MTLALPGPLRRIIRVLLPALVLLTLVSIGFEVRRRARPRDPGVRLRNDLLRARAAADSCASVLADEEARFRAYDARVDSLRDVVRSFEALDPAGVPADSYPSYLAAFDSYNVAVEGWQARADSLQATWAACTETVERHNELADSVRGIMAQ